MISVRDISIGYGRKVLCRDISFTVAPGECILLSGANGSGKSTLMKTIAGLTPPLSGDIIADTDENGILMIPSGIPKIKGFTLAEFIRTGCYRYGRKGRLPEKDIAGAMERLSAAHLADRDISTLSDGEFRKGCIAIALAGRASCLLLDEPTAFLDIENRLAVLHTIRSVAAGNGISVLFSSHDIRESLPLADRVFSIGADGVFRISGPGEDSKLEAVSKGLRDPSVLL